MAIEYHLGMDRKKLAGSGGLDTASEIEGQPELWRKIYARVLSESEALRFFLEPILSIPGLRIILTGAGSSAFIGEASQGILQTDTNRITQAIPSTDLVTHPSLHFLREVPTLMVSFARSGNSPESCEAVRLANLHCDIIYHLIITCNPNGELAHQGSGKNSYKFLLPEGANDKGLAMTGSFTGMLLSILLISKIVAGADPEEDMKELTKWADSLFQNYLEPLREVCDKLYQRVIFLGSGSLLGIARECHLKLQELTDGKVICKHDSFLGFRHGPRAVTNNETLVVYLFSPDEKAFHYEMDLAEAITIATPQVPVVVVGQSRGLLGNVKLEIQTAPQGAFGFIGIVLIGQLMGFFQSLRLGLQPDHPSVNGTIHRVVQGVTIYR